MDENVISQMNRVRYWIRSSVKIIYEKFQIQFRGNHINPQGQNREIINNGKQSIRVYAQNEFYAIFYAIRQLAYTPWLYAIFHTCAKGYDNSVTLSYRIQTNPAPPIQYWMKTLWIRSEFKSKVGRIIICLQNLCDDYNVHVYIVYKCELSSVQIHLFIFSWWDVKSVKRHQ